MRPTTSETPLRNVSDLSFSNEPPFNVDVGSKCAAVGAPSAVYPAAVVDKGNRLAEKSKVEPAEKERARAGF